MFCRPSNGKVSLFLEDFELGAIVISIRNLVPFWCNLLLFYRGRKEDPSFLDIGRFLPIMLGEDNFYFRKVTRSSLYVTTFLIELLLRELPYFIGGGGVSS